MNTKWPTYIQHTVYLTCGHCGAEEGGYTCSPVCRFRRNHYGSEMCAIVRQVFNGVSDETQWMFTYFCFCVYVHVFMQGSLLMCTLHSMAMVTTFFIRAIVVGLPPGSTAHSLTSVKICQFNFFRICCDLGIFRTSRQQTLKLLQEIR